MYSFKSEISKLNGEPCTELVSYLIDNETDICFKVSYAACSAAANTYVKFFNKVAIETENNKWKDYGNNSIYELNIEGNIAHVEHYFDKSKKQNEVALNRLDLSFAKKYNGKYAFNDIVKTEPLKSDINNILGDNLTKKFLKYIAVQGPMKIENKKSLLTSCMAHSCTYYESSMLLDFKNNYYYIGILDKIDVFVFSNNPEFNNEKPETYPKEFLDWTKKAMKEAKKNK